MIRYVVTVSAVLMAAMIGVGCVVRTVTLAPLQNLAVRSFVAHADRTWPGTLEQQAQTADTLDWLAAAIHSLAESRRLPVPDRQERVGALRATIKEFQSGRPDAPGQARVLYRAFTQAAGLIDDLLAGAGLETATDLGLAAGSLDVTRPPFRQPAVIAQFFDEASEALQRIDRSV